MQMEIFMKGSDSMIKLTGLDNIYIQMEPSILEIEKMTNRKERE